MISIAHRGACRHNPENTIPAFLFAKKAGFTRFEMDVQLTKDGVLVICHDYTLERTAKTNIKIAELTYSELKKFNVAKYFSACKETVRIPSLEEVLDALGDNAEFFLEIKNRDNIYPDIAQKIVRFIESKKISPDKLFISSFHHETLKKINRLNPSLNLGMLLRRGDRQDITQRAKKINAACINIHFDDATDKLISDAHKHNLKVLAYTVNEPELAERLKTQNIDGIFTDRVDM